MEQESTQLYQAYLARDSRFDGMFFIGVTSTGIYCRPVCTAKTPKEENCRFFKNVEAAEKAGFRPCLKCRPELAPGQAPVDSSHRLANSIVQHLERVMLEEGESLGSIADRFHLSSRQIRRIIQKEFGVSPMELVLTRRLLLAKQLIRDTSLPITEIAFASGFSSIRRFNDAFKIHYKLSPSHLRRTLKESFTETGDTLTLQLSYRPPYDWAGLLSFLRTRAMKGVEWVAGERYLRTVQLGRQRGWFQAYQAPQKHALMVEISYSLLPVLPTLLWSLRNLFDLNACPDVISAHLRQNEWLKEAVSHNPGLRVPGAWNGFELAVRAVLGQQITVKAATTLAGRLVETFGEKIKTPYSELQYLPPTPQRLALATVDELAALGIIRSRALTMIRLAEEVMAGRLQLDASAHPEKAIQKLTALPGIGKWTAHYIAMRALRWPDAFPKEDLALRKSLGKITPNQAEVLSQAWRPWRSYAVLHLWQTAI
ncbi:AlkA N-terminal domain-containing protein [Parachlamydia sp. AcF125]|uniref:AlkA N-terminal domain-containing protein n=1 Tax=Parachlamydia sp. AcF125 TaxID=2795736 RepID=UPI001BC9B68A|nr:AlkA N-terminal domain-containing protein [Parachlamydia sp. AcF125]MBS4168651.1 putative bifunctional transcriptional activator/DNA repair enzyme AlkA [Parachlamydia sp. AcF125]